MPIENDGDKPNPPTNTPATPPTNPWGKAPEKPPLKPEVGKPFDWQNRGQKHPGQPGSNLPGSKPQPPHNQPNDLDALLCKLSDWLGNGSPKNPKTDKLPSAMPASKLAAIVAAAMFAVWLGSGFYRVQEGQLGVVLRFGEVNRTAQPGLRYHLPYPFETALTPNVTFQNRIEIGFRSGSQDETYVPEESVMLTADQNIIDLNFAVTWMVKDATQYLFEIRDPEVTVKRAAESAMREVVGQTDIQSALTDARDQIQQDTKLQLQQILDDYNSGIEIVRVELLRVNPPAQVIDAFNDVQRADSDRARLRNEAEGYRNKIIPEARGEAERLRNEAEGYRQQVVNAATGEASRFGEVLAAYQGSRQVTAERLYLETMESVLRGKRTVITDGKGVMPYLPLGSSGLADLKTPKTGDVK